MQRAILALTLLFVLSNAARAEEPFEEEPDPTRLDVERLPPEAIEVTRDLYAHGFFVEGHMGARGFSGGVGRLSNLGAYASVGFGYELFSWLLLELGGEMSLHSTDAPPPPSPTVFELIGVFGKVRIQANLSARVALWLAGEAAVVIASGEVLESYGLDDANELGLAYGGTLGFDWHLFNRHYSMGLAGGARLYPSLEGADGEQAIGIHGTAYLRYVF